MSEHNIDESAKLLLCIASAERDLIVARGRISAAEREVVVCQRRVEAAIRDAGEVAERLIGYRDGLIALDPQNKQYSEEE